jgi:putative tryptophan/tyrosine transport system substrate-binding protein
MFDLRRREFIALLGGAAAAGPLAARGQQPGMPVIGYLYRGSPEHTSRQVAAFRLGLSETGYIEGRNVAIEYRWADGRSDRLSALAGDLVRSHVAIIVTPFSLDAARAAKAASATIPIVFTTGVDPVQFGLVRSLSQPGGNVTGLTALNTELGPKQLGVLRDLIPGAARFAALFESNTPDATPPNCGRRRRPSDNKSKCFMQAPLKRSMRPLLASCKSRPMQFWSTPRCYSSTISHNW